MFAPPVKAVTKGASRAVQLRQPVEDHRLASSGPVWNLSKISFRDPLEMEARRVAEEVTQASVPKAQPPSVQLADKSRPPAEGVPGIVQETLRSSGQPLDLTVGAYFGARFGHDFGKVRVHTDSRAAESAKSLSARAYTVGNHMAFAAAQFSPATTEGKRLLAHELTHVVQQSDGAVTIQRAPEMDDDDDEEAVKKARAVSPDWKIPDFLAEDAKKRKDEQIAEEARHQKEEEDRHDAALILLGMVNEHFYTKTVLTALLARGNLLQVVRFFGVEHPGVWTHQKTYQDSVRNALYKYDGRWREDHGLGGVRMRATTDADDQARAEWQRKEEIKTVQAEGYEYVTGSLLGGAGAEITSFFTDDPKKITAGAGIGTATSGTAGSVGMALGQQGSYSPRVVRDRNVPAAVGPWRYDKRPAMEPAAPSANVAPKPPSQPPIPAPDPVLAKPPAKPPSGPMRGPPGGGPRPTMTGTLKTVTPQKSASPVVETLPRAEPLSDPVYWADPTTKPPEKRERQDTGPFLDEQLRKVSNPSHPLHNLVVEATGPDGSKTYDWRKTTFTSDKGKEMTGRYPGNDEGIVVQVGHADAFSSGAAEKLTLEDVDLNQIGGRVIESKGAYSFKPRVLVGPPGQEVPVDLESLLHWERLGVVPLGTALNAKKID